jgi:hypothetical protein
MYPRIEPDAAEFVLMVAFQLSVQKSHQAGLATAPSTKNSNGEGRIGLWIGQGQCLAMGMSFSEREKNLFAGHLFGDFLSWRA